MIIEHNITEDRFKRIDTEPYCKGFPFDPFLRTKREAEIIKREITFSGEWLTIEAYREYTENDIEYIKKYKFDIICDKKKNSTFDDEYVHLSVQGGRLHKPKISKPTPANKGLAKIKKLGYLDAEDMHERWADWHEDDPELYPIAEDGFPNRKAFGDALNSILWDVGFDDLEENPSTAKTLEICGTMRVGNAYFDGVRQYMDEHFKK